MINMLVITNNPSRPSFRQRIRQFADLLEMHEINCTFKKYPSSLPSRIGLLKKAGSYDVVFIHKRRFNAIEAPFLKRYSKKIIYDFDDAVMISDKKPERANRKRLSQFARTVRLCDCAIAGNEYLAHKARQYNDNTQILHTSLKIRDYDVAADKPDDGKIRLVWIGGSSTLMYLEGIRDALEELGRRYGNLVLRIICDTFFDLQNMPVEKHTWSLETQANDLRQCDIALAPLDDNPFTRGKCAFKILQYHACRLSTVASPVGFNSQVIKDGKNGLLAVNTSEWIEKISSLIENETLRSNLGDSGRQQVVAFDVGPTAEKLAGIIINTVKKNSPG